MIERFDLDNFGGYDTQQVWRGGGEYCSVGDILLVLKTAIEECRDEPDLLWDFVEQLIGELSDD